MTASGGPATGSVTFTDGVNVLGTVTLPSSDTVSLANLTLSGGGVVILNSGDDNGRAYIQADGSYTLTNGDDEIQGYGNIGNPAMAFVNGPHGSVDANVSGQALVKY